MMQQTKMNPQIRLLGYKNSKHRRGHKIFPTSIANASTIPIDAEVVTDTPEHTSSQSPAGMGTDQSPKSRVVFASALSAEQQNLCSKAKKAFGESESCFDL